MDERATSEQLAVATEELRVADEELRAQHELIEELVRSRTADRTSLSRLASSLPVPLLDTDPAGVVLEANPAAAQLLRLGPTTLAGKPIMAFVVAEDRRKVRSALSLASAERGAQQVDARLQPRRSAVVPAQLTIVPATSTEGAAKHELAAHWVAVPRNLDGGPDPATVDALAELATLAVGASDLRETLHRVAALAVRGVRGAAAASILVGHPSTPGFVVSTDDRAQVADGLQYQAGEGPTWDAYGAGTATEATRLGTDPRWPQLAAGGRPLGSALAVPLPTADADGRPVGVLTLYGSERLAANHGATTRADIFAAGAAAVLREHEVVLELRTTERRLREALESRAVIDQAKGILMGRLGCGADEAFATLVEISQARNVKLRQIAAQLVSEVSAGRLGT